MTIGFPVEEVREGKARILVPTFDEYAGKPEQHLRGMAPVFYNPVMKTNRDTAVLVLRAHQNVLGRGIDACEPMAGSGVRGIRLALEVDNVDRVVMGDLSPSAVNLVSLNVERNSVLDMVSVRLLDANLLLSLHCFPGGRFDYVDVDPYGSPVRFIDTAIRSVKNHGILALTATDMAPLCGVNPKACIRKYGARPITSEFCHETALRLLIGTLVRQAAMHEKAMTPLFSYYSDHYIRVYCRLDKGKRRADCQIEQIGYIKYCPRCLHRTVSKDNKAEGCESCGFKTRVAGPLWLGEYTDPEYASWRLDDSMTLYYMVGTKTVALIQMLRDEHGYPPWFFDIDSVCSKLGVRSMATGEVLTRISEAGYRVVRTHYSNRGIKSDASIDELKKLLCG
jgi:tRNA (guanine26-N2/guanine27-N2)-dimethyltransferase